jgi:hypothetical protein
MVRRSSSDLLDNHVDPVIAKHMTVTPEAMEQRSAMVSSMKYEHLVESGTTAPSSSSSSPNKRARRSRMADDRAREYCHSSSGSPTNIAAIANFQDSSMLREFEFDWTPLDLWK